jgi:hypothetical protein
VTKLDRNAVLGVLRETSGLPGKHAFRTIYEAGVGPKLKPSGQFYIDYASFPGGTQGEVPLEVIQELEREGLVRKAYPDKPNIKAWVLV